MKKMFCLIMVCVVALGSCTSQSRTKKAVAGDEGNAPERQQGGWDNSYGGADKSYDTVLLQLREVIAPRFKTLTFDDKAVGKTMTYNLFIPDNCDPDKSYPMVLFMADASTTGKGAAAPLKQGYGGIIWATDASQAKHPCFVLVPSFEGPGRVVNDKSETSDEVDMVLHLIDYVVSQYNIDTKRLYTTGQSMGGMISFYLNATHPDLFAASLFVGSQWDVSVLEPLVNKKFFYIVSAADPRASVGMKELGEMLQGKGVVYGTTEFSARLSDEEKEERINKLLDEGHNINFVQFTAGTVIPQGEMSPGGEHMYSFDYAYQLEAVRDWLFRQTE